MQKKTRLRKVALFIETFIESFEKLSIRWISIMRLKLVSSHVSAQPCLLWVLHWNEPIFVLIYRVCFIIFCCILMLQFKTQSIIRVCVLFGFFFRLWRLLVFKRFIVWMSLRSMLFHLHHQNVKKNCIALDSDHQCWESNHTSFVRWNCKEMGKMLIFCVIREIQMNDLHGAGGAHFFSPTNK